MHYSSHGCFYLTHSVYVCYNAVWYSETWLDADVLLIYYVSCILTAEQVGCFFLCSMFNVDSRDRTGGKRPHIPRKILEIGGHTTFFHLSFPLAAKRPRTPRSGVPFKFKVISGMANGFTVCICNLHLKSQNYNTIQWIIPLSGLAFR